MEEETAGKQGRNKGWDNIKPYQYRKGQSGNPSGRPKNGKSLKEYAKEKLAAMTEDEREEFMNGLSKDIIWEMAEGKAKTQTDVTSGGKPIIFVDPNIAKKHGITPSSTTEDST